MTGKCLGEGIATARNDVDHACRDVGRFQNLIQFCCAQWVGLGWYDDDGISHGNRRNNGSNETEQRVRFRASYADDAHRFWHRKGYIAHRGGVDRALILICKSGKGKYSLDTLLHLGGGFFFRGSGLCCDARCKLCESCLQVFRKVVKNLSAQVRGNGSPAGSGSRRLNRVADILSIACADLTNVPTRRIGNRKAVTGIRPDLLAADV